MKKLFFFILPLFVFASCTSPDSSNKEISALQSRVDSLNRELLLESEHIATFLTFQDGNAEAAMEYYMSLFDNSQILQLKRWTHDGPGIEGQIMHAVFELDGSLFMCSDSPAIHAWGFSPAVSNFVNCRDDKQIEFLVEKLSENGQVMMPLDNYGFSEKFAFVEDQFGVSWQLNLE